MTEPNAPRRCIFYNALPMNFPPNAGSSLHPAKMLKGFREIGYEVDLVAGFAAERSKAIRQIKSKLRQGVNYDFLYIELATGPLLLTEPHHLPLHPWLDYSFFRFCRQQRLPVGVFNPDVHWRFPALQVRQSCWKTVVALAFFHLDFLVLRFLADHLFTPTLKMAGYIPYRPADRPHSTLLPGFDPEEAPAEFSEPSGAGLRLLYVGGVSAELYDLSCLLEGVFLARRSGVDITLTICCREAEWINRPPGYDRWLGPHVRVTHNRTRAELIELYRQHNLAAPFINRPYWKLTIPVKIIEAVGMGLPQLACQGTAPAELVERQAIGWSVLPTPQALCDFLSDLQARPEELSFMTANVIRRQTEHSWAERARQVAAALTSLDRDRELV